MKRTDARGIAFCQGILSGTTCTPRFDGAGQPLSASYSDGTPGVSYTYEYGRLKTVTNSAAATSYDYDTLDRVTSRTETVDGASYTFSATWAPAGLKTETYPSGRVVTHTYNDTGQILNLSGQTSTGQRNYVTNAAWAAHGASKTLPLGNGVSETWTWNYRVQPTGVTAGTLGLGYKYCSDGSDTCGTNNGNLTQQTIGHANVTQSYTYDAFGRIADARERVGGGPTDAWVRTYGYDTWGNRWVAAGSGPYMDPFTAVGASNFNAQNQLVLGTAQYDPAGNQTRMGDYTFTYDAENRLKTSTINGSTVTHYYDGEGRPVKRVGPGSRTVVYAYGVDGELAAEYDTEPSTVPGGLQYVAVDHLGSTRAVIDGAGAVTRLEDFLPFGETIPAGIAGRGALYPATAGAELPGTSKRFTGKEREGEVGAGLDYFGARYFSGAQGRFTSPDEFASGVVDAFIGHQVGHPGPLPYADISDPQTLNKYVYVRNSPLRYVDPDGHELEDPDEMAAVVYSEKTTVTIDEAKAIASVVINRVDSGSRQYVRPGDELNERNVIHSGQFQGVGGRNYNAYMAGTAEGEGAENAEKGTQEVREKGPTNDATFFIVRPGGRPPTRRHLRNLGSVQAAKPSRTGHVYLFRPAPRSPKPVGRPKPSSTPQPKPQRKKVCNQGQDGCLA